MILNSEIGRYVNESMSGVDFCAYVDAAGAVSRRHGARGPGGLGRDGAAVRARARRV